MFFLYIDGKWHKSKWCSLTPKYVFFYDIDGKWHKSIWCSLILKYVFSIYRLKNSINQNGVL